MHAKPPRIRRAPGLSRGAAGLLTAVLLATAACDSGGTDSDTSGAPRQPAAAAPNTTTPDPPAATGLAGVENDPAAGLQGALLQFRRDVARRRVEVRLTSANDGLVVDALELTAPGLTAAPTTLRGAQLRRALPLDLPVVLGAADCSTAPGPPAAEVRLRDASGGSRTVTVPLVDDGLAARLHEADCWETALRAQAAIEVAGVREVTGDDGPALRVVVRFRRVGGSDPVRVTGINSNTVYSIRAVGPLPTLREQPVLLDLALVPARCDTHALGESYRTGLIGLVLALGDEDPRPLVLTPDDDVRRRLETFAVDTCRSRED